MEVWTLKVLPMATDLMHKLRSCDRDVHDMGIFAVGLGALLRNAADGKDSEFMTSMVVPDCLHLTQTFSSNFLHSGIDSNVPEPISCSGNPVWPLRKLTCLIACVTNFDTTALIRLTSFLGRCAYSCQPGGTMMTATQSCICSVRELACV